MAALAVAFHTASAFFSYRVGSTIREDRAAKTCGLHQVREFFGVIAMVAKPAVGDQSAAPFVPAAAQASRNLGDTLRTETESRFGRTSFAFNAHLFFRPF